MSVAKSGRIHEFCLSNCILTFSEYLLDYGNQEEKTLGDEIIRKRIKSIPALSLRNRVEKKLLELQSDKRDLYF